MATENDHPFYRVSRNQAFLLISALFLWITLSSHFSSTLFAPEIGSAAFDSLSKGLQSGYATVDLHAIGSERLFSKGKTIMYFGPFPALLRLPLSTFFPQYDGMWARVSSLLAALLASVGFSILMVRRLGSNEYLTTKEKRDLFFLSVLTFILGFPIIFLLSTPVIYHESVIWGLTWSVWGLLFLDTLIHAPLVKRPYCYAGFGIATGLALLSRVPFAIPLILIAPFLLLSICKRNKDSQILRYEARCQALSLILPLAACALFQCWYNYERFGSVLTFIDFKLYPITPNTIGGAFNKGRIPTALLNYFGIRAETLGGTFPFIRLTDVTMTDSKLFFTNLYREGTCSLILLCPTLFLISILAIIEKLKTDPFHFFPIFSAFLVQSVLISCFFFETMRYGAEYIPLMIFCYAAYMEQKGAALLVRNSFISSLFIGLCCLGMYTSIFTTLEWIAAPYNWMVSDQEYKSIIGSILQGLDQLLRETFAPFQEIAEILRR